MSQTKNIKLVIFNWLIRNNQRNSCISVANELSGEIWLAIYTYLILLWYHKKSVDFFFFLRWSRIVQISMAKFF